MALAEFELIRRYFAAPELSFEAQGVMLAIGDDCALLDCPAGEQLAVSMDLLQEGVHFPAGADPFLLAQRCLLVNLSDLAAMGARPLCFTLAISLPEASEDWLSQFSRGLAVAAAAHNCPLVGGDTTRGLLTVCIQVHGTVPAGGALRRNGASAGDLVYVTGTLGDAAAALDLLLEQGHDRERQLSAEQRKHLLEAFYTPESRIQAGIALRDYASAAIDISDGLSSDLLHILEASSLGARVRTSDLPLSAAFRAAVPGPQRLLKAISGGDDYELCFTVPPARQAAMEQAMAGLAVPVSCIGEIVQGRQIVWLDEAGAPMHLPAAGYNHFNVTDSPTGK